MFNHIYLLVSCLFPVVCHSTENQYRENYETICFKENSEALHKATYRYLNFINQISTGEVFPQMEAAAEIISPNCKKVLNGQLFTQNREDFVTDLLSLYENQGGWKVIPAEILIVPLDNTVVLRIFIEMEKFGSYTAIVILRYDESYLVTEINEVLSEVKGSYDFEDSRSKK